MFLDSSKIPIFSVPLTSNILLYFNKSDYFGTPDHIEVDQTTREGVLQVTGLKPVSSVYLDVANCTKDDASECRLDTNHAYVRISVIKSHLINLFTVIVGWMYFAAWSLSFYPQIYLNFKRKSVTGLNFDFLLLNLIGFSAYGTYNLLMYYDPVVQAEYETQHPRSPIPVLLNDVVFAVHAFTACVITAAQCFLLERDGQRVSITCIVLASILILFAVGSGIATLFKLLTVLQFVMCFSYIKMAVTLSKYFPQMYFNFRRKSTVGWSIGNVLLDFTGGTLDILQMVLQCINAADWVAFYGNPVKFGLGLVSILFDIIFIFQHYVLYRGVQVVHAEYAGIVNTEAPQSSPPGNHGAINPPDEPIFDEDMR
ncbi:putative cystinosin [Necator americanus]|uniref:Cystinosin homolog n=1 Tax=Necator americanus TaxID=51031 RepID=W2SM82_NECAM|nr:putative cystinosin [Necator americanus]ETN70769.1 putative cystinosin [Necator americanus]